jgi:transglutaminase-like putative cysteine protease
MRGTLAILLAASLGCRAGIESPEWEAERQARIRKDYPLTRSQLLEELRQRVREFKPEELDRWETEGRLDSRIFDGERRYLNCLVSNLFFRYPDLRARRIGGKLWAPARLEERPVRFHVVMTVTVKADAVPAGKTIRAWLPFPRDYETQTEIRSDVRPPDAPMRAAYFEKNAEAGKPVVFRLEYEFTRHPVRLALDPAKARPVSNEFVREQPPHVVFTPELRALARKIVGDEANPLLKARKIYDWCVDNLQYSFAHEYSTLLNISDFCYRCRYGDCGEMALLFITLCRASGVPARWQSGWVIPPGGENLHDWTEIAVDPWGWIPVDPCEGGSPNRPASLGAEERRKIRDFYFGGLDPYRMVANRDHGAPLVPPKRTWRSDTVDFQRGELEWGVTNLYFDQFDYSLKATVIPEK